MFHVLIIEDEALIALDIQGMLEDSGATSFDFAETEDDAIEAALAHRPDIITSDVTLRVGTGPRAVAAIHARMGPVPVIFITATPYACEPGDDSTVLGKPIDEPAMLKAFDAVLHAA